MNRNIKTIIFIFLMYFFISLLFKYFFYNKCNKIIEGNDTFFIDKSAKSDPRKKSSIVIKKSKKPCPKGHPTGC